MRAGHVFDGGRATRELGLVYTPIDSDFRSWKRYRGGRAQDVWIYDLAANTSLQLTTDRAPAQR